MQPRNPAEHPHTPRLTPNAYGCGECGMVVKEAREYHPYWFCVLYKAGQDPRAILKAERERWEANR